MSYVYSIAKPRAIKVGVEISPKKKNKIIKSWKENHL